MQLLAQIAGWALMIAGLPLFWTPLPVGAVMIAAGAALVIGSSARARAWLRRRRSEHPHLDEALGRAELKTPQKLAETLEKTDGARARAVRRSDGPPHASRQRREAAGAAR